MAFFAASHGKNVCDQIVGTIKRLAVYASLQRTNKCQVLTPRDPYKFATEQLSDIKFFYMPCGYILPFRDF